MLSCSPSETPMTRSSKLAVAPSFNGRTSDSDSLDRGSNPWGATNASNILDVPS